MTDAPYREREWLWERYVVDGFSQYEIAEMCNVDQSVISRWMNNHGIEKQGQSRYYLDSPVRFETYSEGYERWDHISGGDRRVVRVHRLLAVAEYGFDAVCDMDVHHKNGIHWDNRRENIELLDHSEHSRFHQLERGAV